MTDTTLRMKHPRTSGRSRAPTISAPTISTSALNARPGSDEPGPSRTGSAVDAALAADLSSFVMRSPSSYHAAYAVRERLVDHGFEELDER